MTDISSLAALDVMHQPVVCAEPADKVKRLEHRLVESGITGMPVVENGRLVGIVSRSDFARVPVLLEALDAYAAEQMKEIGISGSCSSDASKESARWHGSLEELQVRDIMARQVVSCDAQTPVPKIAAEMCRHHVHRIVVLENDRPVGIISSLDLVKLLAG